MAANREYPLPDQLYDALEDIDAAIFTGESFRSKKSLTILESYLRRWSREAAHLREDAIHWERG